MDRRRRWSGVVCLVALASLAGCAAIRGRSVETGPDEYDENAFIAKPTEAYRLSVDEKGVPYQTVIGQVRTYRIKKGDTLLDVARYYDLGYNEIVDTNPGVDPWVPAPDTEITLPTQWVLPCCTYDGVVLNIPEMRLFQYEHHEGTPDTAETVTVRTYPVGLGRDDWRTPRRDFHVRGKTVNPRWNIPESIRREHIAERGDHRKSIAGGDPDNPLGKYRIELGDTSYAIHGTNIPWGVGMLVSHGCVRLYPEDIERLYPRVAVGSKVRFQYQPVKLGARGGAPYVEVHKDVYRISKSLEATARSEVSRRKLTGSVDPGLLESAVEGESGLPVEVSRVDGARHSQQEEDESE